MSRQPHTLHSVAEDLTGKIEALGARIDALASAPYPGSEGQLRDAIRELTTSQKATLEAVTALRADLDAALYKGHNGRPGVYEELKRAHTRIDPLEKWSGMVLALIVTAVVGGVLSLVIFRPGAAKATLYPPAKEKPVERFHPRASPAA
jgi:hypothetical protein